MIRVSNISLGYKASAIFAVLALVLSLATGFIAGVRWDVVLVRSVILMALFGGIGFGVSMILQKFVPEVYQILSSVGGPGQTAGADGEDIELPGMGAGQAADADVSRPEEGAGAGEEPAAAPQGEFTELEKEGLAQYSSSSGGSPVNTRSGKLGKHILEKEKMAKYEPKIMAQAVRTMMSKDRE